MKNWFEKECDIMDDKVNKFSLLTRIIAIPLGLAAGILFLLFEGLVIMTIWNWFLVGVTGITMTLGAAVAIDLIAGLATYSAKKRSTYESLWAVWQNIIVTILSLLVGFVLHLFV